MAQGEYIAPERIEMIYNLSEPVAQIFVHGDSLQVGHWRPPGHTQGSLAGICAALIRLPPVVLGVPCGHSGTRPWNLAWVDQEERDWGTPLWPV